MKKMWTSPKLVKSGASFDGPRGPQGFRWWFCRRWLRDRFAWPESAKSFWITLGPKPSTDRVAVEFKNVQVEGSAHLRGRTKGASRYRAMHGAFKAAIRKHFGPRLTNGPLYLGLLYEEVAACSQAGSITPTQQA